MLAPLYGIILGPLMGPLTIALGTFLGFSVGAAPVFLGLDFLPATVCAAVVGLVTRRRRREAVLLNFALIITFLLLPFAPSLIQVGPYQIPYVWLHLVGLGMLASPLAARAVSRVAADWTFRELGSPRHYGKQFLSVLLLGLIGTLAQHIMGGILTQAVIGLYFHATPRGFSTWQNFWAFIFWLYPPERAFIAVAATALAAPVVLALKFSRLTQHLPRM